MSNKRYEIEEKKPFSESLIWQLNRNYYEAAGLDAWREGTVPHHLTSNSMVGKTYAELIFAYLHDLATKGQGTETVYILELGAGHGRLAFHILQHLERLVEKAAVALPPYCYVLSDIVEENLLFFQMHPQFQPFFKKGLLDVAHFDAVGGERLELRFAQKTIEKGSLQQPIIALANYFFDSLPTDLFKIKNKKISECWVALETKEDPTGMDEAAIMDDLKLVYYTRDKAEDYYENAAFDTILDGYADLVSNTHLLFPKLSLQCVQNIKALSQNGMLLLTMDKGFSELLDLDNTPEPLWSTHGSFSIAVNFHAFKAFCAAQGGTALFPSFSTFHLQLGCLFFGEKNQTYQATKAAYLRYVDDFGPDDFFGLNKFTNKHIAGMTLRELIGMLRLGAYDSTLFLNILPRIKQVYKQISRTDRTRLAQTLHQTWRMYFTLNESKDLAYEMGGIFYDLGYYQEALDYFQYSINLYGHTADGYYNRALCHYQLREDVLFAAVLQEAEAAFPDFAGYQQLRGLDMEAV